MNNKDLEELFETIETQIEEFKANATKAIEKGNKSAARRARKSSMDLRNSLKEFKARSMNI